MSGETISLVSDSILVIIGVNNSRTSATLNEIVQKTGHENVTTSRLDAEIKKRRHVARLKDDDRRLSSMVTALTQEPHSESIVSLRISLRGSHAGRYI